MPPDDTVLATHELQVSSGQDQQQHGELRHNQQQHGNKRSGDGWRLLTASSSLVTRRRRDERSRRCTARCTHGMVQSKTAGATKVSWQCRRSIARFSTRADAQPFNKRRRGRIVLPSPADSEAEGHTTQSVETEKVPRSARQCAGLRRGSAGGTSTPARRAPAALHTRIHTESQHDQRNGTSCRGWNGTLKRNQASFR